jgi:hypothetical protein
MATGATVGTTDPELQQLLYQYPLAPVTLQQQQLLQAYTTLQQQQQQQLQETSA